MTENNQNHLDPSVLAKLSDKTLKHAQFSQIRKTTLGWFPSLRFLLLGSSFNCA